jgi:putative toxin-antitoxin system antitoxin component (TIGR02293 family)
VVIAMAEIAGSDIASLLGLHHGVHDKPFSALSLIGRIEAGLPVAALQSISDRYAPEDKSFVFRVIPKATLDRRKRTHHLTSFEGDLVARLARIWAVAVDVWQDDEAARAFLFRPHPLLDGRKPVDLVLGNELGAKLVEDILGRLKYGTAA